MRLVLIIMAAICGAALSSGLGSAWATPYNGPVRYSTGTISIKLTSTGGVSSAEIVVDGVPLPPMTGGLLTNPGFSVECDITKSFHTYPLPGTPPVDCIFEECSSPANKGVLWCETRTNPRQVLIAPTDFSR